MGHARTLLFVIIGTAQFISSAATAQNRPPVSQLVNEVQDALSIVSKRLKKDELPPLDQAEITLQTTISSKAGGGFEFFIVTLGGEVTEEEVQTMVLTLKPPPPASEDPVSKSDFSDALANAIIAAARGVAPAMKREPKLDLTKLDASISFGVKTDGKVGAKLIFVPITVNFGGGVSKNTLHKVKLVYGSGK